MSEVNKLPYEKKQKIKKYIKENYKNKSLNEMAEELGLNHGTVSLIKTSMGLTKGKYDFDDYLTKNYEHKTVTEMAKELNVTRNTVRVYAEKLGLTKYKTYRRNPFEIECDLEEFDSKLINYCITSHGRIFNKITRQLINTQIKRGYEKVSFKINNNREYFLVHRMLAFYFVPSSNNDYNVVNHLDGVKSNNSLFNLEWTTIQANTQHASIHGLMRRGESHSSSKMTNEQALELINFYNNGGTKSEAINNFDFVTKSIAEKIYNKSRWKHLSHLMKW